jgi:hypothetical protein
MALAERSGNPIDGGDTGAIPPIEELLPPVEVATEPPQVEEVEPEPQPATRNNSNLILIGAVALIVGGVAYYLKIVRPKKNAAYDDEDFDDSDFDSDDDRDENEDDDFAEFDDGGDKP